LNSRASLPLDSRTVPLVMGILNVTPDSFSDGGCFLETSQAVERALAMAEEGADILDVGGESTRPGSDPVPLDTEMQRVIPVIESLASEVDLPISVDTRKPDVALAAVEAGAVVINDVEGFRSPVMLEGHVGDRGKDRRLHRGDAHEGYPQGDAEESMVPGCGG